MGSTISNILQQTITHLNSFFSQPSIWTAIMIHVSRRPVIITFFSFVYQKKNVDLWNMCKHLKPDDFFVALRCTNGVKAKDVSNVEIHKTTGDIYTRSHVYHNDQLSKKKASWAGERGFTLANVCVRPSNASHSQLRTCRAILALDRGAFQWVLSDRSMSQITD